MTLSLLLVAAVSIPLLVIAGLLLFSKWAIWGAVNPRTAGAVIMSFAVLPVSLGLVELIDGFSVTGILHLLMGVLNVVAGWGVRRQAPASIE